MKAVALIAAPAAVALAAVALAFPALAEGPRDRILAAYAAEAKAASPSFAGFAAGRGQALYLGSDNPRPREGGNPETPACATCHTRDPSTQGRHAKTGRGIDPMAVSANPARFTNAADVEKRFSRDCPAVMGRPCTAQEKGDFITWLAGQ
jgi:mono/diheme cytochrome c family protein